MKKVLLILLAIIVIAGALAGAGFAGYRIGYKQAALAGTTENGVPFHHNFQFDPQDMPMHNFGNGSDRNFNRGMVPSNFGMTRRGMGFGFFPPLMFLGRIVFWGLVIWFVYWLFTKSGWQLTRTHQPVTSHTVEPTEPEKKTE